MAITEEIDLTLESFFAGEDDPNLLPHWKRERMRSDVFYPDRIPIVPSELWSESTLFWQDGHKEEAVLLGCLNLYVNLFGCAPHIIKEYDKYDPYAPYYMMGAGVWCDRCGDELHFFNTSGTCRTLCDMCDVFEEKSFWKTV